jgi:hypothetical protein
MTERKKEEKKEDSSHDGSEKIRPEKEKDFPGIERAKKSRFVPATEVTKEWQAREEEGPTP